MGDEEKLLVTLKKLVQQELSAELKRHARAGHPINRTQALGIANVRVREKLLQLAARDEKKGADESAESWRDLANELPGLMRELGMI